ncbi:MAG: MerR family transcriptional regulator [Ferruginibacter sp.]
MHSFTIKDIENLSGIKAHTIRIWEQRYSFLKPHRSDTNIRNYSNEELKVILNIALLNKHGYKISHIDKMTSGEMKEKILLLNPLAQQERVVNALIQQMIEFETETFESTLEKYIASHGIENTILQIVFPFLEKIGILWMTNHIIPAQEHLVSNIIRQKIINGIETTQPLVKSSENIVLFLPESEYHELGLLFMHYMLKSRGLNVIYLGANIPLKDVEFVVNLKKPAYIYSHLTAVSQSFNFGKFISEMIKTFPTTPIILSGMITLSYLKKVSYPISFKRSFKEVIDFVNSL